MRLRPRNQRICPRRSSLSAQSISSSSSASSSPSSSPGSKPSPASFRQGRRSVGTVAITWKQSVYHVTLSILMIYIASTANFQTNRKYFSILKFLWITNQLPFLIKRQEVGGRAPNCPEKPWKKTRSLYYEAGIWLGYNGGSLLIRVNHHGNLCGNG